VPKPLWDEFVKAGCIIQPSANASVRAPSARELHPSAWMLRALVRPGCPETTPGFGQHTVHLARLQWRRGRAALHRLTPPRLRGWRLTERAAAQACEPLADEMDTLTQASAAQQPPHP